MSHTLTDSKAPKVSAFASLVGRILLAAIFILSGFDKIAAPAMTIAYMNRQAFPFQTSPMVLRS